MLFHILVYCFQCFKFGGSISVSRLRAGPERECSGTTRLANVIYGLRYSFYLLLLFDLCLSIQISKFYLDYFYYICYQILYIHIHTHTDIRVCMLIYRGVLFRLILSTVYLYVCGYRYTHMHTIFLGLYYSIYLYVYKYKYTHMHTIYWGLYLSGNALTFGLLFVTFWF